MHKDNVLYQLEHADISEAEKWVIKDHLYRRAIRANAHNDFSAFCESVIKSEEDVNPITNLPQYLDPQPFHREWCEILQSIVTGDAQSQYIAPDVAKKLNEERRVIILSPRDTGKTSIFTLAFPIWVLGRDPSYRIGIISKSSKQAKRPLASMKKYMMSDSDLKMTFPNLIPMPSETNPKKPERWTTEEIIVRRSIVSGTASICSYGVGSKSFLGCRLNLLLIDDLVSFDASKSHDEARMAVDFYNNVMKYSVVEKNGITIAVGTPWGSDDLLSHLSKQGWPIFRYSCEPDDVNDGYRLIEWEKRIPKSRLLEEKRTDIVGYNRNRRCRISSSEEEIFSQGKLNLIKKDYNIFSIREWQTAMGMDLSTSKRKGTAICITASDNDGQQRIVLDIVCGQWQPNEKAEKIRDYADMYKPNKIYVENNSLQDDVVKLLIASGNRDLPIDGWTTKRNKHALLEALSLECKNELWRFNTPDCAIETMQAGSLCKCDWCEFIREVSGYPNYTTSDMLMSWLFASEALKDSLESGDYYKFLDASPESKGPIYNFNDFYLGNRVSNSHGFIPQVEDPYFVKQIQGRWGKEYTMNPVIESEVESMGPEAKRVLSEMIHYCNVLNGGTYSVV